MKTIMIVLFILIFISCEKNDSNIKETYESLPDIEYNSQNYSVNNEPLIGKMIFNPPNPRTGARKILELKYQEKQLTVIEHTTRNSLLIMFAVDTEIGDILSIYESQGTSNRLAFINGRQIELEQGYAIVDLKIKEDYFIFRLRNPAHEKFLIYKP